MYGGRRWTYSVELLSVTFNDATPTWFEFVIFPLDFPRSRVTSALSSEGNLSNFGYSSIFTGHNACPSLLTKGTRFNYNTLLYAINVCSIFVCMCVYIYIYLFPYLLWTRCREKPPEAMAKNNLFIYPSIIYIYIYSFICLCMPINKYID